MKCEGENDDSQTQVAPTVAGSEILTLQSLLLQAAPMLKDLEAFSAPERMALAATILEKLEPAAEEDYEPGSWIEPWV